MRRRWIASLTFALLLIGVGVWQGPNAWESATTQQAWQLTTVRKGGFQVTVASIRYKRGDESRTPVREKSWHLSTGLPHTERTRECFTIWSSYGRVLEQQLSHPGDSREITVVDSPPWHFDVTNREVPDAPWIEKDLSFDDWWDSIPAREKLPPKRVLSMPRDR